MVSEQEKQKLVEQGNDEQVATLIDQLITVEPGSLKQIELLLDLSQRYLDLCNARLAALHIPVAAVLPFNERDKRVQSWYQEVLVRASEAVCLADVLQSPELADRGRTMYALAYAAINR